MNDTGEEAAVQASLDGALGDLLRAAVENPTEPDATSYARIDAVFDHRMAPHRHLAWALAEAERLKRQLKSGLRGHAPDAVEDVASARAPNLGEAQR
ncbi:hypothetical protein MKK75_00175 [Methylobacterium sp. J-030]|uniref:hypothetical protein n=1 Tax=Methylobacterium sp. J-030 TaxID=2836627 RepID=UPI001FB9011D|nr:hypothetical protein [Methylobacterium sp. J-030]MCJ2067237.1 hypothetical protein [Methylobacterium sp. J-030]